MPDDNKRVTLPARKTDLDAFGPTFSQFVETGGEYLKLVLNADIRSDLDRYTGTELFNDGDDHDVSALLYKLKSAAEAAFAHDEKLSVFVEHEDRSLKDLAPWKRPFTHADIEEKEITARFEFDRGIRSLIKAWVLVIQQNQWRHIRQKRILQGLSTAAPMLWSALLCMILPAWMSLAALLQVDTTVALAIAVASWVVVWALGVWGTYKAAKWFFLKELKVTTDAFKAANEVSCSRLSTTVTKFKGEIEKRFERLLSSITGSGEKDERIKKETWPESAKGIFKIAMWEGERLRALEKFLQFQFERLRIFQLVTDEAGNLISRVLSVVLIVTFAAILLPAAAVIGGWVGFALAGLAVVTNVPSTLYFGAESRRGERSFSMDHIVGEVEQNWKSFSDLGYEETLATSFQWGLDAKRTELLNRRK